MAYPTYQGGTFRSGPSRQTRRRARNEQYSIYKPRLTDAYNTYQSDLTGFNNRRRDVNRSYDRTLGRARETFAGSQDSMREAFNSRGLWGASSLGDTSFSNLLGSQDREVADIEGARSGELSNIADLISTRGNAYRKSRDSIKDEYRSKKAARAAELYEANRAFAAGRDDKRNDFNLGVYNARTTRRGQDQTAATARRGQDMDAATARRNQDMSYRSAAAERKDKSFARRYGAYNSRLNARAGKYERSEAGYRKYARWIHKRIAKHKAKHGGKWSNTAVGQALNAKLAALNGGWKNVRGDNKDIDPNNDTAGGLNKLLFGGPAYISAQGSKSDKAKAQARLNTGNVASHTVDTATGSNRGSKLLGTIDRRHGGKKKKRKLSYRQRVRRAASIRARDRKARAAIARDRVDSRLPWKRRKSTRRSGGQLGRGNFRYR